MDKTSTILKIDLSRQLSKRQSLSQNLDSMFPWSDTKVSYELGVWKSRF